MPKVFISRSLSKDNQFYELLTQKGFQIFSESLIEFTAVPFLEIPRTDWVFFYSANAVKYFFSQIINKRFDPKHVKYATMGEATAEALASFKKKADFVGTGEPAVTAKGFLKKAVGKKVLFPRAKNSKCSIQLLLKNKIEIEDLVVYNNQIKSRISVPYCDFLVFTSPLNGENYFINHYLKDAQTVIAIGQTTAKHLRTIGIENVLVPENISLNAISKLILKEVDK